MTQKTRRKVSRGQPLFPDRPRLTQEELARRKAEDEAFGAPLAAPEASLSGNFLASVS